MEFSSLTVSPHKYRSRRTWKSAVILLLVHCWQWQCCNGFVGSTSSCSGDGRWSRRCPLNLALPLVKADKKIRITNTALKKASLDKSILIVENDDDLRKAIGKFLAKGGYHVTGVSDARSAMLVCRGIVRPVNSSRTRFKINPTFIRHLHGRDTDKNSTSSTSPMIPNCLVLDIQLGGSMDGLGLLNIIRSDPLLASIPVVLLTAKGKVQDRIIGYESEADAYLPKPFEPEELLSIIDGLLLRANFTPSIDRYENAITNAAYGDIKRELTEIMTLLNLNAPRQNSLQRDVSEIKDKLKDLVVDQNLQHAKPVNIHHDSFSILSPVERQIINLVAKGLTNKNIAGEMECSNSKIEKHVTSMMKKVNVKKRADLVDWWRTYSRNIEQSMVAPEAESEQNEKGMPTTFSAEETTLLELLETGMTTEEIVTRSRSSKKRVAMQLSSLFDKAGVRNRTELVRWWKAGGNSKV